MPSETAEQRRDPVEQEVASIWRRRVAWSRAADALKARLGRARTLTLLLASAGAVLETAAATFLAAHPTVRTVLAGVGAAALAAGTYLAARLLTVDAVRSWTRARSVSEGMKKEVYAFRAGAAPYAGPDASGRLVAEVHKIEAGARDLELHAGEVDVGNPVPPPPLAPADYVAQRVVKQSEGYYRRSARRLAKRLGALRGLELSFGLLATVAGAVATYGSASAAPHAGAPQGVVGAWVAVLTTLAGAIATHVAAGRYDFLVMSYYATARRLDELVEEWRAAGEPVDTAAWSAFVQRCEEAISVENESWLAKWAEKNPERRA